MLAAELLNLPVSSSLERKQEDIQNRRVSKLTVAFIKIPFPEQITTGWMTEYMYYPDITTKCLLEYAQKSLAVKALNEGENLINAGHVKNVEFNNISQCLRYCFVRGDVIPQTRVNETPYKTWVCMTIDNHEVLTGECGCIAGYSESCKHVFALLHLVVHQVALGLKKTCTSRTQVWNKTVAKGRKKVHLPAKMSSISFKRPHPEHLPDHVKVPRTSFDPRAVHQRAANNINWDQLASATDEQASVLCFRKNVHLENDHTYNSVPENLLNVEPLTMEDICKKSSSSSEFFATLAENRTENHINIIEDVTKGQASNKHWFSYRHGMITASVSHSVISLFKNKNPSQSSVDNLIAKTLGYNKPIRAPALIWGTEHEQYARKRYIASNRKVHKKFKCTESGLKIHQEKHILGASVDGLVQCSCCEPGNLEIKCPFTHRDETIEGYVKQKDACLELKSGVYSLKLTHQY